MKTMFLTVTIAALLLAATASAATGDPRVCARIPGLVGQPTADQCAHAAAGAVARARMATNQHVTRWRAPMSATRINHSILAWDCFTWLGGDQWHVTVRFTHNANGWHQTVALRKTR